MRKLLLALCLLTCGQAQAAWFPRFLNTLSPIYGPLTASANPFTVSAALSGDPKMSTVGSPATVRVAGDYQLASGQVCTAPSTAISVSPAPAGQRQWLAALAGTCTLGIVAGTVEPVNAVAEALYPSIAGPVTTQIAIGDGQTTVFAPAFALTGTISANANTVDVASTAGVVNGMPLASSIGTVSGQAGGILAGSVATVVSPTQLSFANAAGTAATSLVSASSVGIYLGNTGGTTGPKGFNFPYLNAVPVPGSISLQVGGATVASDGGTMNADGTVTVSGSGVSCQIVLLENTKADLVATTHGGYYRCDFGTAPADGVPIGLTYRYGWVPVSSGTASPIPSQTYLIGLLSLLPSADETIARQLAQLVRTVTMSIGIPILDPSVAYGVPAGKVTAAPCSDMTKACSQSGTNSNAGAVTAACPDYDPSKGAYTWAPSTLAGTGGVLTFTGGGDANANVTYCGFDLATTPGSIVGKVAFQTIRYNRVRYNVNSTAQPSGLRVQGGNQLVEYNDVWLDETQLTAGWNLGECLTIIGGSGETGVLSNFTVRRNNLFNCARDGVDVSGAQNWTIVQNVISPGGATLGSHTDGIQTLGLGSIVRSGTIDRNYISDRSIYIPSFWASLNAGVLTQHRGVNAAVYPADNYDATKTAPNNMTDAHSIAITNNYVEGGQRLFAIENSHVATPDITVTGNITGPSQSFSQASTIKPTASGNARSDSGAIWSPF